MKRGVILTQIIELLEKHPEGMTAKDMASILGVESARIINAMIAKAPIYQTDSFPTVYFLMK